MYIPYLNCYQLQPAPKAGSNSGMGVYYSSNWVTPQRLISDFRSLVQANMQQPTGWGMSGLGCSCGCGGGKGCAENKGMSGLTMDGSGLFGTGIFGTGVSVTDFSTWTWAEYVTVFFGFYLVYSLFFTTRHAAQTTRKHYHRLKKKVTGS
jgi:hypothetical protein